MNWKQAIHGGEYAIASLAIPAFISGYAHRHLIMILFLIN
jgi:hypothetical protein